MAIEVHPVQRIRVEEESSFASDLSGSIGNFKDVPVIEGSANWVLNQEMLDPGQVQQHIDQQNEKILGIKSGTLSFDVPLAPTGVAADNSTTAVQSAIGEILKVVLGSEILHQGDTINDVSPEATDFDVSNIARWSSPSPAGKAIGLLNSNSVLEVTEIESSSGDNLIFKRSFSFTPSNGAACYSSALYNIGNHVESSLQFAVEGLVDDDRWLLLGCQLESWSFNFEAGQVPTMSLSFQVAAWLHGEDAATPLTGASLANASYTNYSPIVLKDSAFIVGTVGNATRQSGLKVSSFSINPNLVYTPITSPGGLNESDIIAEYVRTRSVPVFSGQFTLPFENETYRNHKENRDDLYVWIELGQTQGNMIVISLPTIQITDVQRVDVAGIASQTVSFEARRDTETSGNTGEVALSAAKIHFL